MENKKEIELELGWLVNFLPEDLGGCESIKIIQAYLENNDPQIKDARIREKGGVYTYTIKRFAKNSQETGYCTEETREISKQEFSKLLGESKRKVVKTRFFYLLADGLTAEVDIYEENLKGLNVVEVEFPSIEICKKFNPPNWFGKEVTDSNGIYPPFIANLSIEEVNKINQEYTQKPHNFD
ncbi:MAG: hypothetical protein V1819_00720 [bacterium]